MYIVNFPKNKGRGVEVLKVQEGSLGHELELKPGDRILSVNGRKLRDFLDFQFLTGSESELTLEVLKPSGEQWQIEVERDEDEIWGLEFETFMPRQCANECIFCFCDQNPQGARPSLSFKDEDIRLSFLYGNYTTMTSITQAEMERIVEQRLSPQYVSVHATDSEVRRKLLGFNKPDHLMEKMRYLTGHGIELHCQIVLCPGYNDGAQLQKTVFDLAELHPGVTSVAVVPLGITPFHKNRDILIPVTDEFAASVIRQVEPWQQMFRRRFGAVFVFLADEFYLRAGFPIPGKRHYGDYPQIEDGVGMVRTFLDGFNAAMKRKWPRPKRRVRGTLATGKLFYPILESCAKQINEKFGTELKTVRVANHFFGEEITVSGLLTGGDLLRSRDSFAGEFLIIPEDSVNYEGYLFLDDMTVDDLSRKLCLPIYRSGRKLADFFKLLFEDIGAANAPKSYGV